MATYGQFWRNPDNPESHTVRETFFRPGKTRFEHTTGAHASHLQNKEARRDVNRYGSDFAAAKKRKKHLK